MNVISIKPLLPDWKIYDNREKPVCNFTPIVLEQQQVLTSDGKKSDTLIRLFLDFGGNIDAEVTVAFSKLNKLDWPNLNPRCIIDQSNRNAKGYIANIIQAGLIKAPVKTVYYLDQTGIFQIDNSTFFLAGDRVISRSSAPETDLSFMPCTPFHLDIDESLAVADACKGMHELISLSPEIGRVLVAHVISGIIRAAFKEAGFTPCAVLVITGGSGMLKTSYVPHLTQLYNRNDGIGPDTRFNSTQRFIEDILFDYSECTAVIDDLHTAESGGIKKRAKETAEEIIRQIGDDTGRGYMDGRAKVLRAFRGNVVFIGEYTVGKGSTIPRALVANITRKPNGEILYKYQRHQPLLVSTFYFYFIQWYVEHFTEICADIDNELAKFRKDTANSNDLGRFYDTHFYLCISYKLFLRFCEDSGYCSHDDIVKKDDDFSKYLDRIIQAQIERYGQNSNSETVNYLELIRRLYRSGFFSLANDKMSFKQNQHDGLIYYGCLCLRRESLQQGLSQFVPHLNVDDCINSLADAGALKLVGNKRTVQIDGTGGKRFYAIWLQKLQ